MLIESDKLEFYTRQYTEAKPFPHVVIDGLWDNSELTEIAAEFMPPEDPRWITYPDPKEFGKRCCSDPGTWGTSTREWFVRMFNDQSIMDDLETLTGIDDIFPDVVGGGMHMTSEGGRLAVHADFNVHPHDPRFERRINFLVFLNRDWDDSDGGVLYLGENQEVAVSPQFNRTVIFSCSKTSYHGHPDPIVGANLRKSLACYYYTARGADVVPHSTLWLGE